MNTKQAIYFLENNIEDVGMPTPVINERIKDVINLLQRGEKYEQMWGKLEKLYGKDLKCYPIMNERGYTGNEVVITLNDIICELEQKYFPKPIKKERRLIK